MASATAGRTAAPKSSASSIWSVSPRWPTERSARCRPAPRRRARPGAHDPAAARAARRARVRPDRGRDRSVRRTPAQARPAGRARRLPGRARHGPRHAGLRDHPRARVTVGSSRRPAEQVRRPWPSSTPTWAPRSDGGERIEPGSAGVDDHVECSRAGTPLAELPPLLELRGIRPRTDRSKCCTVSTCRCPWRRVALLGPTVAASPPLEGLRRAAAPSGGEIHLAGRIVTGASADHLARLGVCTIPEGRGIFPNLTVRENLWMATMFGVSLDPRSRTIDYTRVPRLKERRKQLAGTLSGGEQQMLAIVAGTRRTTRRCSCSTSCRWVWRRSSSANSTRSSAPLSRRACRSCCRAVRSDGAGHCPVRRDRPAWECHPSGHPRRARS